MQTKPQFSIPPNVLEAVRKVRVPEKIDQREVVHASDEIRNSVLPEQRRLIVGKPKEGAVTFYLASIGFVKIWPVLQEGNTPEMKV